MKGFETEQEKKSFVITTVLCGVIIALLFLLKFSSTLDIMQLEGGGGGGIAVNFGDSEVGSGKNLQSEVLNVSNHTKATPATPAPQEEIIGQDYDDAPVVATTKKVEKTKVTPKPVDKPVPTPEKPKPSKSTTDALANLMNGSKSGGDGDDNASGNKGKLNGDKNASGYYGGGGSGNGKGSGNGDGEGPGSGNGKGGGYGNGNGTGVGNYQLAGRKAISKPRPNYNCNEEGFVAVEIEVDKNGKVIGAEPGVRGTTNAAKCLLDQARIAAMQTKFDPNPSAPDKQVGKIIYNFKLTE